MKALFEAVPQEEQHSFFIREVFEPRFTAPWHFHPEFELTLILSGSGIRFVGDSAELYGKHDLVLLGPNLPHLWSTTGKSLKSPAHAVVAQFSEAFISGELFRLPELTKICQLAQKAVGGLAFSSACARAIEPRFRSILLLHGAGRLTCLLETLEFLASQTRQNKPRVLCSSSYEPDLGTVSLNRVKRACDFVLQHFQSNITLSETARAANMSPSAFSRFFHRNMGIPLTTFIHRVRIGHASRLLAESDEKVVDIALESGYANLSNFNRWFLAIKGETPSAFRTKWRAAEMTNQSEMTFRRASRFF
jgi:AraC-like DNA-binding protein